MLRRLRSIAQYTAIALTYAIEPSGSQRPGGVMVSVFFYVLLVVVGCGMLVVGLSVIVPKVRTIHSLILVRLLRFFGTRDT